MARKKKHEEHVNHEAWAIPYGDLITLLLAFFVAMYAISSVNDGKYRALSDSLQAAFAGVPKRIRPVEFGENTKGPTQGPPIVAMKPKPIDLSPDSGSSGSSAPNVDVLIDVPGSTAHEDEDLPGESGSMLDEMADAVEEAMADLIDRKMVKVRRSKFWLEVEITTDILFPSGVADFSARATPVLDKLAGILKPFPNSLHVEGHTDNVPIATTAFPSNWELSAARAASVVHLFEDNGVDARRMAVQGMGEHHPVASNDTPEGRNANRRVVLVVMAEDYDRQHIKATRDEVNVEDGPLASSPGAVSVSEPEIDRSSMVGLSGADAPRLEGEDDDVSQGTSRATSGNPENARSGS